MSAGAETRGNFDWNSDYSVEVSVGDWKGSVENDCRRGVPGSDHEAVTYRPGRVVDLLVPTHWKRETL